PSSERLIRAEPSLGRRMLGVPYMVVSATAWPLKHFVFFMEDVNLPARVGDAVTFPVRVFADEDEP
ncbi:MAG: hypothetical protein ACREQJ_11390, partial [Candidatus Binatia bacterium]